MINCASWLFEIFSLDRECGPLPACYCEGRILTYSELSSLIAVTSEDLLKKGVVEGDRVAFLGTTTLSTTIAFFALLKIGASPCILSARAPKAALQTLMQRARISFFLEQESWIVIRISTQDADVSRILIFTSGSSGNPKLACLTFSHFLLNAQGSAELLPLVKGKSNWLLSVPLFHVSGLSILFRCLLAGASFTIAPFLSATMPPVTHMSLVPTQLLRLLDRYREVCIRHVESVLLGGAPISRDILLKGLGKGLPIKTTYGMTEMASQITVSHTLDSTCGFHAGKPAPGKELSLAADGEILVKGNSLFSGYDIGGGPILPLTKEGWFATGDLGALSTEGNLIYKGRKDQLFISGGENIYPEEIEKALGSISGVLMSFVIPVEDREYGMRPIAFVHMDDPLPSKEEFHEKLVDKIPKFAFPVLFFSLPVGLNKDFKIQKTDLKTWYVNNYRPAHGKM